TAGRAYQRDLTTRLEPFDPCRGDRPCRQLGLDGGAGDERDPVTRCDRAPHRLLQAELEPHVEVAQPQARAAQLVVEYLADAGTFLYQDQRLATQLIERDRLAGEAVTRRD